MFIKLIKFENTQNSDNRNYIFSELCVLFLMWNLRNSTLELENIKLFFKVMAPQTKICLGKMDAIISVKFCISIRLFPYL